MNWTIEPVSQPVMTKPVELELTGCAVGPLLVKPRTPGPPVEACWRAPRCGSLLGGRGGVAGGVCVEGGGAVRRAEVVGHTVDFSACGGRFGVDGHAADRVEGRGGGHCCLLMVFGGDGL